MDESHCRRFYGYAVLMVDGATASELRVELDEVMSWAADEYGVDPSLELHGHAMMQRREGWEHYSFDVVADVFREALRSIFASGATASWRSIDKASLALRQRRERYHRVDPPEEVALRFTLQQVQGFAKSERTHALVIVDRRQDGAVQRALLDGYRAEGTPGSYMRTKLDRVVDTLHYSDSASSRLLQAADLVAYFHHRRDLVPREHDRRAERLMNKLVKRRDKADFLWSPRPPWP